MQRSAVWLALVIAIGGVLLSREIGRGTFAQVDSAFLDWLVANSSTPKTPPAEVVVFELRDDTADVSKARPLTPLECALFFQAIEKFEPPVVVSEPLLRWEPPQPEGEQMVLQRALKLPRLVASSQLGTQLKEEDEAVFPENVPVLRHVTGEISRVPEYRTVAVEPFEELTLASMRGFLNQGPNANCMPLVFRLRGELVPSAVLQALIGWKKLSPSEVKVEMGKSIQIGGLTVPIDSTGCMLVNRSLRKTISAFGVDDLLFAAEQMDTGGKAEIPENQIRHGITIFAHDPRVPREESKPPVVDALDLATAIATAQTGAYIGQAEDWISYVIIAFVAVFALIIQKTSRMIGLLICVATLGIYGLVSLWVFESFRLWMPFVLPSLLLLFLGFARLFLPKPKSA